MKNRLVFAIIAGILELQAGCILDPIGVRRAPNPQVILQAFLTPDAPADSVVLRTTIPSEEYYVWIDLAAYAISGANVVITNRGQAYMLAERRPGTYGNSSLIARSGERYDIEVTFPPGHRFEGKRITAHTTVPERIHVSYSLAPSQVVKGVKSLNDLVFPKQLADPDKFGITSEDTPFSLSWNKSAYAEGCIVGTSAVDTSGTGLLRTRSFNEWKDGNMADPSVRQYHKKMGYVVMPDSLQADIYWLLFMFGGAYDVAVIAADTAYYDYFASVASGPAGQSGSDADFGIVSNVKGGTGVFGSYAADTVRAFIKDDDWLPSEHQ